MGRFIGVKNAIILFSIILIGCGACTRQQGEPKELPRTLGTDAERGTP